MSAAGIESRVAAAKLTVLAPGDAVDVAGLSVAASTSTWLAHETRAARSSVFTDTRLARLWSTTRAGRSLVL